MNHTLVEEPPKGPYKIYTIAQLMETAKKFDCELVVADSETLLLDLDALGDPSPSPCSKFIMWNMVNLPAIRILKEKFGIKRVQYWASRSGHLHVLLHLATPIDTPLAIAIQALLGSDPKRESIACWEYMMTNADSRSLFRPRSAAIYDEGL